MSPWVVGISEAMALAAVALIGYMFGRRTRTALENGYRLAANRELDRAAAIVARLEKIADSLRQALANHHTQVLKFKRRLRQVQETPGEDSCQILCDETEQVLVPTMSLANQLSQAYDQLRQQSQALSAFTVGRVDELTGIATVQALEEQIAFYLHCQQANHNPLSVAILMIDAPLSSGKSGPEMDRALQNVAHLLQCSIRGSDFLARYGADEFAILLPNTNLRGANQFALRIRKLISEQLEVTVSIGLAESILEDDSKSILVRADSALYSARTSGGDEQFFHNGLAILPYSEAVAPAGGHVEDEERTKWPAPKPPSQQVEESLDELDEAPVEAEA